MTNVRNRKRSQAGTFLFLMPFSILLSLSARSHFSLLESSEEFSNPVEIIWGPKYLNWFHFSILDLLIFNPLQLQTLFNLDRPK